MGDPDAGDNCHCWGHQKTSYQSIKITPSLVGPMRCHYLATLSLASEINQRLRPANVSTETRSL